MTRAILIFSVFMMMAFGLSTEARANAWDHCRICMQVSGGDHCGTWDPPVCGAYGDTSVLSSVRSKQKCIKIMLDCQDPKPNCRICLKGYYGDHCGTSAQDCTPYGGGWSPVIRKYSNADAIKCGQIAIDCGAGVGGALPVCGNGVQEAGEDCDDGGANGSCPSVCSGFCRINNCGSCVADGGSFTSSDPSECGSVCCSGSCSSSVPDAGCSSWTNTCGSGGGPICGNGIVESGEQCDEGTTYNGPCPTSSCGDNCMTNACAACTASGDAFVGSGDPGECVSGCCSGACSSIAYDTCGGYCSVYIHTCA